MGKPENELTLGFLSLATMNGKEKPAENTALGSLIRMVGLLRIAMVPSKLT